MILFLSAASFKGLTRWTHHPSVRRRQTNNQARPLATTMRSGAAKCRHLRNGRNAAPLGRWPKLSAMVTEPKPEQPRKRAARKRFLPDAEMQRAARVGVNILREAGVEPNCFEASLDTIRICKITSADGETSS